MSGNIVAVTGCVIGMAHSRMAAEALRKAAAAEGIQFAVEIHGFAGVEGKLSAEQIAAADVVIVASDVNIGGLERFEGKPLLKVGPKDAIRDPAGLLQVAQKKAAGE